MDIILAAVGRAKRSAESELVAHYLKLTRWNVTLKELPDAPSGLPPAQRKAREAEQFRALLTTQSRLIALDAGGDALNSVQFSKLISKAQDAAVKRLVFAIGGQDGLDEAVLKDASAHVAFGAITLPHMLARVVLAEQLYRAYTISIGHPYHTGH